MSDKYTAPWKDGRPDRFVDGMRVRHARYGDCLVWMFGGWGLDLIQPGNSYTCVVQDIVAYVPVYTQAERDSMVSEAAGRGFASGWNYANQYGGPNDPTLDQMVEKCAQEAVVEIARREVVDDAV